MYPTIFVIFGVTGDLSLRKLIPALLALYAKKMLPQRFQVIGFSRRPFSREEFRTLIREGMHVKPGEYKEEDVKHFLDHMSYERGYFDDASAYERLAARIAEIDDRWGQCSNKLYHLSVPPSLYGPILSNLAASKLNAPCADDTGWTRVLIEKPFGNDLATAEKLDGILGKLFDEEQIFRIDHYLAKEALQNILAFRFHNSMFEPIWKRGFIDKVHVKLFESVDVSDRGDTYDAVGALKDVGQNHMLMMLAAIAMERPKALAAADIRTERARVIAKLRPVMSGSAGKSCNARARYDGYAAEKGVKDGSQTETYFRLRTEVKSSRWKGVPFFLESGKAMAEAKTEIDVYFKPNRGSSEQNILTFRIQPDEGIKVRFFVKTPGYEWKIEPKTLKFKYADQSAPEWQAKLTDYERLIHDAFVGDQTLFASTDEIMASWRFVGEVLKGWTKLPLGSYARGAKEVR